MEAREVIEGVVPIPIGCQPIKSRWLYRWKQAAKTDAGKAKARLVAKGYSQLEGIDYGDTFAPTGKNVILRLMLIIVMMFGMTCHHIDVNTAFLYATLEKPVYIFFVTRGTFTIRHGGAYERRDSTWTRVAFLRVVENFSIRGDYRISIIPCLKYSS